MQPPKIIREVDPQEGRGCWMGCFGIGCLIVVVGFFGLLAGGWYSVMHTRLPLIMLEQAIEQDGRVKIEGLTGSVSKGVHIDQIKFLTVDDEHWSELRGIKFDYNGFMDMSRTGKFVVDQMTVDSGTIYADIEGPADFLFSPGDLNSVDEFRDSDLSELRVNLLQVNNLKIVNLDTDYSIEIETASLKDFVAEGKKGIADLGELTIKSNVLEASTEPSPKWTLPTAKRIRGTLRSKFSDRMKKDVDFALDWDFDPDNGRRAVTMFDGSWRQEFNPQERSVQLENYSPDEYFVAPQLLPTHIQLLASHAQNKSEAEPDAADRGESPDASWVIAPGASFQLGKTTFQIESVEGNRTPLRSIVGKATLNGETFTADLRCRDYFQKGRIDLRIDQQPADRTDWARVIYGADFESLARDEQRMVEATIEASKSQADEANDKEHQAEADDDEPPSDAESPSTDSDSNQDE